MPPRRMDPTPPPPVMRTGFPVGVGPVTILTALYVLAYLAWERSGSGSPALRDLVGNVGFMPLNLAVGALFLLASSRDVLDPGVRRALRLIGIGSLCVLVGNIISATYVTAWGESPLVSWADPFYLGDSFLMFVALLSFPLARRLDLERVKFGLDAAMVLVGGGILIWYFAVRPNVDMPLSLVAAVLTFAYPLASLLVLVGVTTVLLRRPIDRNRLAFGLLVAGVTAGVIADLTFGLVQVETGERGASLVDAVYLLTYLLLVASAELYSRLPVPRAAVREEDESRTQPLSPLPYVAVASTFTLLLVEAFHPDREPMAHLAVGALVITVLLMARQFLSVRQNIRLLAEQAARANEARFRSLVQHSSDVILVVDPSGLIRYVSPSAARVLRYDPDRLMGHRVQALLVANDREQAVAFLEEAGRSPGLPAPVDWEFRQPDGTSLPTETIATNLLGDPTVGGIVLNIRDVSERKRLQRELSHQAFHDSLTGLANRALFRDRVSHALTLARRQGRDTTVIFLDLDDFKKINDSLGHAEGDRLLKEAAQRLGRCARATDTVARLGGDEFGILVEDMRGAEGAAALVGRLADTMREPFKLGLADSPVSASFGVATAAGDESADDLIRNADLAMYTAKRQGKGRHATYEAQMVADSRHRLELEAALRTAIERQELVLHYQPILHMRTGQVFGFEALVRWDHPKFGHLMPPHFVPLAEETGLIVRLGAWVLRESCAQIRRWRADYPRAGWTVSVNLSGRQVQEQGLVQEARAALAMTGVDPDALVLEITESVLMEQTDAALQHLRAMKALGVRLAIDDFGTGYSSLSYLQRFPIDILKIAKPFIDEVGAGAEKAALARAIIGLGDTLKLTTIAEGVEVAEQKAALLTLGCDLGQGHLFAKPMPAADIERMLREGAWNVGPAAVRR